MTAADAVNKLIKQGYTKYRIGKSIGVSPTSIEQYLRGTKPTKAIAERFKAIHGIEITEVHTR